MSSNTHFRTTFTIPKEEQENLKSWLETHKETCPYMKTGIGPAEYHLTFLQFMPRNPPQNYCISIDCRCGAGVDITHLR
ncbi:MAG: hypothetical protein A2939_01165 [Parcubacteria group bacterium RIFCSPLOWO2_01_FULL_48_18]|nr:MAG: hypothetical protein A2939_01165 [Parcubacteria group bacterium RIFCSPLOWO2_01_FULL_48_18]OHB23157.1 MAG: hypothetical protein A3J67_00645 [Parcubacteria group bacterium RIFCSPHIGHO2_02_FULL_48_10b]